MPQEQDQHSAIWPADMQDDPMVAGVGDDDFSKFLDLDTDFHFAGLDNGPSGLDTPMGRLGFGQNAMQSMQDMSYNNQQSMNVDMSSTNHQADFSNDAPTSQQYEPYQQYHHMPIGHNYHVPPTPVSSEMHATKYGQRMDNNGQMVFDAHQVSFTPLVSPAQTPLTGGFTMPDYGLTEDFFSPLTSPALEAQGGLGSTGTTASPVDLNVETPAGKTSAPATRRSRRKGSVSTRTTARSVKQSPAMKPQTRRRQPSLSSLPMEKIENLLSQPPPNQQLRPNILGSHATRGSDESVSPEPLSEALMRPPPIPLGVDKSPRALLPSHGSGSKNPATPATLMRMPSDQRMAAKAAEQAAKAATTAEGQMEDIMLPDAATPSFGRPVLSDLDVRRGGVDDQSTPTLSAKSAKVSAASTPRSATLKASSQESFNKPIKIEGKGGRGNKKRQSTSSAAISPALRPKISPSISPLVPASGPGMSHLSAETSALYLASKSNYQNIIDGTHLPGVSYPEALAENLSSKRTSHKIAEQGRRNRINLALKEIETLLPASIVTGQGKRERTGSAENEDGEKGGSSGQGASKASTVEMAIVYIKSLQAELEVTKDKLQTAEKKLAEGNSSAGSQTSE